jgi:hypothetical protein
MGGVTGATAEQAGTTGGGATVVDVAAAAIFCTTAGEGEADAAARPLRASDVARLATDTPTTSPTASDAQNDARRQGAGAVFFDSVRFGAVVGALRDRHERVAGSRVRRLDAKLPQGVRKPDIAGTDDPESEGLLTLHVFAERHRRNAVLCPSLTTLRDGCSAKHAVHAAGLR